MPQPAPSDETPFNATDIASAILLAAAGGLTDAVVYIDHGHVFANAMTGNVIFLGIAAVGHDWQQVLRHTIPIVAFFFGVVAARLIHNAPIRRAAPIVLALEAAALFFIGLLPAGFPQLAFTGVIAFVSAFQVATFRHVGRFTYNSTFITGNLRMVAEGFFDWLFSPFSESRSKGRAQAWKLAAINAGFLLGAICGAAIAPHFPVHAILFTEPPLLAALVLVLSSPGGHAQPSMQPSKMRLHVRSPRRTRPPQPGS
jgi:uncharacterized membrane protein YoaK (UPF0700 family)